jgi:hypothetical protein
MLLPGVNMMKMDADIGTPPVGARKINVALTPNALATLLVSKAEY